MNLPWAWIQVAVLMGMTNVVRAVGDRLGPRWGAIVLGLPSTTAVLLVGGGFERGPSEAARASEIGLLGLVASVTLPICYARAVARGRNIWGSIVCGVAGYVLVATSLRLLPGPGLAVSIAISLVGIVLGCCLARRLPIPSGESCARQASRSILLRTIVPAAFLFAIRGIRTYAGPEWAGVFATFPAMSMAVLVTIHLEGGRAAVCRMARSMPRGALGTIAFLTAYRLSSGDLSPLGAAAVGYAAVLVVMAGLVTRNLCEDQAIRKRALGALRLDPRDRVPPHPFARLAISVRRLGQQASQVPRYARPFAPRIEAIVT
jgi:hypothetical protein